MGTTMQRISTAGRQACLPTSICLPQPHPSPAPWNGRNRSRHHRCCAQTNDKVGRARLFNDLNEAVQQDHDHTSNGTPANSPSRQLSAATPSSVMSTALNDDELAEIQRALARGPSIDDEDNEEAELIDADDYPQDFWATDLERVYLVGVEVWGNNSANSNSTGSTPRSRRRVKYSVHESLEELARLADTAGLRVVGSTYQSLEVPNGSTFIGSGKVAEVARAVRALKAETVIFDAELSPGQLRNLERSLAGEDGAVRVCDRTALILDIFSQRAATKEGKLQVELAQVEYQLPRLTRMWSHLDRVGGGGQVKGAGEKQIEMDKRLLRDKAAGLRKELESVRGHRRAYRERRAVAPIPVVALVGYTNAGKSTLLNCLTDAGVLAEDKLFATLDPTTRKIRMRGNRELLLSDTVGFIQKLPTELVAAFRATLEEVQDASVLLHLVDISHPNAAAQCEAVLQVLDELNVSDIPLVTAWNKLDACADADQVRRVAARRKDTVCVSGRNGEGITELLDLIASKLSASMTQVTVSLPYSAGDLLDDIHTAGEIVGEVHYIETGMELTARVPAPLAGRLRQYCKQPLPEQPAALKGKLLDDWDGAEGFIHTGMSSDEESEDLLVV